MRKPQDNSFELDGKILNYQYNLILKINEATNLAVKTKSWAGYKEQVSRQKRLKDTLDFVRRE